MKDKQRTTWRERDAAYAMRSVSAIAERATTELEGLRREQHRTSGHTTVIESCPDCRQKRWAKSMRETGHHEKCPNRPGGSGGFCGTECTWLRGPSL